MLELRLLHLVWPVVATDFKLAGSSIQIQVARLSRRVPVFALDATHSLDIGGQVGSTFLTGKCMRTLVYPL